MPVAGRETVVGYHILFGLIVGEADGVACLIGSEEDTSIAVTGDVGRVGKGVDEVAVAPQGCGAGDVYVGRDGEVVQRSDDITYRGTHIEVAVAGSQGEYRQSGYGGERGPTL